MYRTVLGTVEEIGTTYIHEHLYVVPNELPKYQDYTLDDIDRTIQEVGRFTKAGGHTLVDLTPVNYGRNPIALEKIARETGANILFVTGFHKEEFLPTWVDELSNQEIYDFLIQEIVNGVSSHELLPSAMKIGTSLNQVTNKEKRIIEIAGEVQRDMRIPMITHCDQGSMGVEQLQLLRKSGADIEKICLSHCDLMKDVEYLKRICDQGASLSFDHVGRDLENKDKIHAKLLTELVKSGYEDFICLAGDMGRKKYHKSYQGSPGLDYILTDFKEIMLDKIPEKSFEKMITLNPQRQLNWSLDRV